MYLLPRVEKVLVNQADDVEAIGDIRGVPELLPQPHASRGGDGDGGGGVSG